MSEESMVEKVARAMENRGEAIGLAYAEWEDFAHAAIEEVGNGLTPRMVSAFLAAAPNSVRYIDFKDFRAGWKAAIDAALKETA